MINLQRQYSGNQVYTIADIGAISSILSKILLVPLYFLPIIKESQAPSLLSLSLCVHVFTLFCIHLSLFLVAFWFSWFYPSSPNMLLTQCMQTQAHRYRLVL